MVEYAINIYIIQLCLICFANYYTLPEGSTMYDFITFDSFEKYFLFPAWVCAIPLIGTFLIFVIIICVIVCAFNVIIESTKKFLKRNLNFKIK